MGKVFWGRTYRETQRAWVGVGADTPRSVRALWDDPGWDRLFRWGGAVEDAVPLAFCVLLECGAPLPIADAYAHQLAAEVIAGLGPAWALSADYFGAWLTHVCARELLRRKGGVT